MRLKQSRQLHTTTSKEAGLKLQTNLHAGLAVQALEKFDASGGGSCGPSNTDSTTQSNKGTDMLGDIKMNGM